MMIDFNKLVPILAMDIIQLIAEAAGQVSEPYLRLRTTYEPTGIVRERVFCYELYHQIRLILGNNNEITLNGEIDKRGHIDFATGHKRNPDFVFHIPGTHHGNTVVMEVKGRLVKGIIKDFETLSIYTSKYRYQFGVFLLYNYTFEDLKKYMDKHKKVFSSYSMQNIYCITLPEPHKVQKIYELNELL